MASELSARSKVIRSLFEDCGNAIDFDLGERVESDIDWDRSSNRECLRSSGQFDKSHSMKTLTHFATESDMIPHLTLPESLDNDRFVFFCVILTRTRNQHHLGRRRQICR